MAIFVTILVSGNLTKPIFEPWREFDTSNAYTEFGRNRVKITYSYTFTKGTERQKDNLNTIEFRQHSLVGGRKIMMQASLAYLQRPINTIVKIANAISYITRSFSWSQ